jgi:hypothetical protein
MSLAEEFKQVYDEQGWIPQSMYTLKELGVIGYYAVLDDEFLIFRAVNYDFEDGSSASYIREDNEVVCFPYS